jgi:HPr kinase/phosphorylase
MGFLREKIEQKKTIGGVLVDLHGKGVLIQGESGTGKSSSALRIIFQGGRLVSDDVVDIYRTQWGTLIGESPGPIRNLMEIKGQGIVNLKHTLGLRAVKEKTAIAAAFELTSEPLNITRKNKHLRLLGVDLPLYQLSAELRPQDKAKKIIKAINDLPHRFTA